jgi:hypothetical protein
LVSVRVQRLRAFFRLGKQWGVNTERTGLRRRLTLVCGCCCAKGSNGECNKSGLGDAVKL